MDVIEKLQDINLRVAGILEQQQQLKSQALNWEKLYRESIDVQKKLLEQSNAQSKEQEALHERYASLKLQLETEVKKHQESEQKYAGYEVENASLKSRIEKLSQEMQSLRLKAEQQMTLNFGTEKEQEKLKAINEDLKEQLAASQQLNHDLQTELQAAKITLVEEQADAKVVLQQKDNLLKEIAALREQYRHDFSNLHSKNAQAEIQVEKLNNETKKLQEALSELSLNNAEKQNDTEMLRAQVKELQEKLDETPLISNEAYLQTSIGQLQAQVNNLTFENNLIRKNMAAMKPVNQPSAENTSPPTQPIMPSSNNESDPMRFLHSELEASQQANSRLEARISEYIEIIAKWHEREKSDIETIKNLQEPNKFAKLAEAIEGNSVNSNQELRQKLGEMIKEVDRCIAKLSS